MNARNDRSAVLETSWRTLLAPLLGAEVATPLRVSAFLRIHAQTLRDGRAWDIPATIAAALDSGAAEIEQQESEIVQLREALALAVGTSNQLPCGS